MAMKVMKVFRRCTFHWIPKGTPGILERNRAKRAPFFTPPYKTEFFGVLNLPFGYPAIEFTASSTGLASRLRRPEIL
jgi:hypothetical protein